MPKNWEDASNFVPDTYVDIEAVYEKWLQACDLYPMWRGQTGFFPYIPYEGLLQQPFGPARVSVWF